jgi:hypothetical protein
LIHHFVKVGIVPERVVLRPIGAVPGVEVIGRVEQSRDDGADRQIVIAGRRVTEPNRFNNRPQVGLNTRLLQHRLDGLAKELVMVEIPHHEIQGAHAALAGGGQ